MPGGLNMDAQNLSSQEQDGLAGDMMNSLGEPKGSVDEVEDASRGIGDNNHDGLPDGVKDRIWRQDRKHQREIRDMKTQIQNLNSRLASQSNMDSSQNEMANPYHSQYQPGSEEERIHKAVGFALQARDAEERKAKEAERIHHVNQQYHELNKHLDDHSDKYEDFDDVVRGQNVPFTPHMRDAALLLPRKGPGSAAEVLYKLGKNTSELDRISKLQPIDQASEMVKLSHALNQGQENKTVQPKPLGQIKSSPVTNSNVITDKTPVSELRARMKAGWK